MINELGLLLLCLALGVSALQATWPLLAAYRQDRSGMSLATPLAHLSLILLAGAYGVLTYAYVVSDFSLTVVISNSHSLKPMLYKIAGVWGNHEGSLLLWILITALFGALVAFFGGNLPLSLKARVLAVQGAIVGGFLAFAILTSNPFARTFPAPADGQGLNPFLQDPGLAFHPPFLYLGYFGLSITYAFAIAALLEGRIDAAWAKWMRPWTLFAWSMLTIGIAWGAWWAYYELGWGGFWAWDPVENVALMPWLAATALLHSVSVVERRDAFKAWTVLLAILAFTLSLLGTFIVRSGLLSSVHSFASDPARGLLVLMLIIGMLIASFILFAWRVPQLTDRGRYQLISREGALVLNNIFLCVGIATILLGTMYPLALEWFSGRKISVGAFFFNLTFVPIMLPMLIAMGFGPMLSWKQADLLAVTKRLHLAVFAAIGAGVLWGLMFAPGLTLSATLLLLAFWLIFAAIADVADRAGFGRLDRARAWSRLTGLPRRVWGTTLAHGGLGICMLGLIGGSAWVEERHVLMATGDTQTIAGYEFTLTGSEAVKGPNYDALQAFMIASDGSSAFPLTPESRVYTQPPMPTTEAGIHSTLTRDLFVTVQPLEDQPTHLDVSLSVRPFILLIWIGAGLMALGGFVSLTDRGPGRRRDRKVMQS